MAKLTAAQVKKDNRDATKFLVHKLRNVPPTIIARLATATVRTAVTSTYQDSGRFAWNWNVRWGSGDLRGGSGAEYGRDPVGNRGDARGTAHPTVYAKQKTALGLSGGKLYQDIIKDNPTFVTVFNPFYTGLYGEHAAEAKGGTASKEHVPSKIEAAVAKESARTQYELNFKG